SKSSRTSISCMSSLLSGFSFGSCTLISFMINKIFPEVILSCKYLSPGFVTFSSLARFIYVYNISSLLMKKITRFFWFCSGAHIGTLKKYPLEHNKYVGIGATIFFTALFASLSGGYAMYFVFSGSAFAVGFAILFGLIWGMAIFNM